MMLFLEQGKGKLSARAKSKEFRELKTSELKGIERKYQDVFGSEPM